MKSWFDKKTVIGLGIGLILTIITFPNFDLSSEPGIDPPLKWVFTHFYTNGFSDAQHLNFPHGPLAFFMYPLQETLLITAIAIALLKILIVFLFTRLFSEICFMRWVHIIATSYILFVLSSFNLLIIAAVLTAYLVTYKTTNSSYKLIGFLLTAIALYIKSYVGIITGLMTFSFIVIDLYRNRSYFSALLDSIILFGLYSAVWLFLFGNLNGFLTYFYGVMQLAQDNSSAAAYYPWNNWLMLGVFLTVITLLPFFQKSDRSHYFGFLILPAFFGAWKHGMAREDISHVGGLFTFALVIYLLFFLFEKKRRFINMGLVALSIYCFCWNIPNAYNYTPDSMKHSWLGVSNFLLFSAQDKIADKPSKIIPAEVRALIGNQTVDVYPWDYSIAAQNNLNWKPRPILHSYAAYTHWLDKRNSDHFSSSEKPNYIIWELNKISSDLNGGDFSSIDSRYLLNDEPLAILSMLSNYQARFANQEMLILQKRNCPIHLRRKIELSQKHKIMTWIKVPEYQKGILRVQIEFEKGIQQRMKSFLYKDEQYWIEMKHESGEIHKYRFVPKNAKDGLWIAPYITNLNRFPRAIKEIRISVSNSTNIERTIDVAWENITSSEDLVKDFFQLPEKPLKVNEPTELSSRFNSFNENWKFAADDYIKTLNSLKTSNEFPCTFIDSLKNYEPGIYKCHVQFNYRGQWKDSKDIKITFSTGNHSFFQEKFFYPQLLNTNEWNQIVESFNVEIKSNNGEIKMYIHNPNRHPIELKNIEFFLQKLE